MAGKGKKRIKLQLITNESTRKTTFRKRKAGLLKKANELTTLCGIDGCVIIYGPNDKEPEVWPSMEKAEHVLKRFKSVPEDKRTKNQINNDEGRGKKIMFEGETSRTQEAELEMLMEEILEVDGNFDGLINSMSLEEMKQFHQYLDNIKEEIPDEDDKEDHIDDVANNSSNDDDDDDDDYEDDEDEDYVEEEETSESISYDKSK